AGDIGSARPQAAAEAALVTARWIHGIEVLHDLELLVHLLAGVDDLPVRRDRERCIAAVRPERREVAIPGPHRIGHRLDRSAAWSGAERADLRQAVRSGVRVIQGRSVRAPARRPHPLAKAGQRLDGRLAFRADLALPPP